MCNEKSPTNKKKELSFVQLDSFFATTEVAPCWSILASLFRPGGYILSFVYLWHPNVCSAVNTLFQPVNVYLNTRFQEYSPFVSTISWVLAIQSMLVQNKSTSPWFDSVDVLWQARYWKRVYCKTQKSVLCELIFEGLRCDWCSFICKSPAALIKPSKPAKNLKVNWSEI